MELPRIKIRKGKNALHLTDQERRLVADVLRSLERSAERERVRLTGHYGISGDWGGWQEIEMRLRINRAAMRQVTGLNGGGGKLFILEREGLHGEDLDYVRTSLGIGAGE